MRLLIIEDWKPHREILRQALSRVRVRRRYGWGLCGDCAAQPSRSTPHITTMPFISGYWMAREGRWAEAPEGHARPGGNGAVNPVLVLTGGATLWSIASRVSTPAPTTI